jgi:hypothetical protein
MDSTVCEVRRMFYRKETKESIVATSSTYHGTDEYIIIVT